jgi:ribosomal protein S18 acetylase RimI-like enzyme
MHRTARGSSMSSPIRGTGGPGWPEVSWQLHVKSFRRLADRVGLTVDDDNFPAVSLYKSLGFREEM